MNLKSHFVYTQKKTDRVLPRGYLRRGRTGIVDSWIPSSRYTPGRNERMTP